MSPETGTTLDALMGAKRVLCIQPHYDDNDIFAGGTLALLHDRGAELTYLTVTDDLVGVLDQSLSDEEMRARLRAEQSAAGAIIGVDRQLWLNYPDAGPIDYTLLRRDIIECLRRVKPDYVFSVDPWLPYEAHRDHVLTGLAAAEAVLLVGFPRLKTSPEIDQAYRNHEIRGAVFYNTASPNLTVDIGATYERKQRAVSAYRAQFSPADMQRLLLECETNEKKAARRDGFERAELLKIVQPSELHCNTETWISR